MNSAIRPGSILSVAFKVCEHRICPTLLKKMRTRKDTWEHTIVLRQCILSFRLPALPRRSISTYRIKSKKVAQRSSFEGLERNRTLAQAVIPA